jgi:hypothetical protein
MRNQNDQIRNLTKHFSESLKSIQEILDFILNYSDDKKIDRQADINLKIFAANLILLELVEKNVYFQDRYRQNSQIRLFILSTVEILIRNQSIFYHKFDLITLLAILLSLDIDLEKCQFQSESTRSDYVLFFASFTPYIWSNFLENLNTTRYILNQTHLQSFIKFICYLLFCSSYNDVKHIYKQLCDILFSYLISPLVSAELSLAFIVNICNYFDPEESQRSIESNVDKSFLSQFDMIYKTCGKIYQANITNEKCRSYLKQGLIIALKFYSKQLVIFYKLSTESGDSSERLLLNKLSWFRSFFTNESVITMNTSYFQQMNSSGNYNKNIVLDYHNLSIEFLRCCIGIKFSQDAMIIELGKKSLPIILSSFEVMRVILISNDFSINERQNMLRITFELLYELYDLFDFEFWIQVWEHYEIVIKNGVMNWSQSVFKLIAKFCETNTSPQYQPFIVKIKDLIIESWQIRVSHENADLNAESFLERSSLDAVVYLTLNIINNHHSDEVVLSVIYLLKIVTKLFECVLKFESDNFSIKKWFLFCSFYSIFFKIKSYKEKILSYVHSVFDFVMHKTYIYIKFNQNLKSCENTKSFIVSLKSFLSDRKEWYKNHNEIVKYESFLSLIEEFSIKI